MLELLNRKTSPIRMRNYGRIIQDMLMVASNEPDKGMRERMTVYIAQCMRQKNILWNKDQDATLQRIKNDIAKITEGRLSTDFPAFDTEVMRRRNNNFKRNQQ